MPLPARFTTCFGPRVMAAFVDAHDANASPVARAQARDRAVAWKKMDDALEPKGLGENHVDRESMGENGDPCLRIASAGDGRERGQNARAKFRRVRAKVANGIGQKALPFLAPVGAQRFGRAISALPAIGFRPAFHDVDGQSGELRERLGGLTRPRQRTGDYAGDAFAGEQRGNRPGLTTAICVQGRVVGLRSVAFRIGSSNPL